MGQAKDRGSFKERRMQSLINQLYLYDKEIRDIRYNTELTTEQTNRIIELNKLYFDLNEKIRKEKEQELLNEKAINEEK